MICGVLRARLEGEKHLLNLLVVGNGFDLAHGLPTRYSDFLDFMQLSILLLEKWYKEEKYFPYFNNDYGYIDMNSIAGNKEVFAIVNGYGESITEEFRNTDLYGNFKNGWLQYFFDNYRKTKHYHHEFQWVDLESDILKLLKATIKYMDKYTNTDGIPKMFLDELDKISNSSTLPKDAVALKFFEYLFHELKYVSHMLKFYLSLIIEEFNAQHKKGIFKIGNMMESQFEIDYILSFNYTDLSRMLYAPDATVNFINGCLTDENIILGIENPSPNHTENYCDNNIHWFFKNVQRVRYDYQNLYKGWLCDKISESNASNLFEHRNTNTEVNVYIIGHSLAMSDRYILKDVIENADHVTIYYYSDRDKNDKITNLYKLLGDEDFSNLVNQANARKSICFSKQEEIFISSE